MVIRILNEADRATWTFAHCSLRERVELYRWMVQERITASRHEREVDGKEDEFLVVHECWECVSKYLKLGGEGPARGRIMKNSRDYEAKSKQVVLPDLREDPPVFSGDAGAQGLQNGIGNGRAR